MSGRPVSVSVAKSQRIYGPAAQCLDERLLCRQRAARSVLGSGICRLWKGEPVNRALVNPKEGNPSGWEHSAGRYPNGALRFDFAEGHSEIHKWRSPKTCPRV